LRSIRTEVMNLDKAGHPAVAGQDGARLVRREGLNTSAAACAGSRRSPKSSRRPCSRTCTGTWTGYPRLPARRAGRYGM
jgi:hypothetical protein